MCIFWVALSRSSTRCRALSGNECELIIGPVLIACMCPPHFPTNTSSWAEKLIITIHSYFVQTVWGNWSRHALHERHKERVIRREARCWSHCVFGGIWARFLSLWGFPSRKLEDGPLPCESSISQSDKQQSLQHTHTENLLACLFVSWIQSGQDKSFLIVHIEYTGYILWVMHYV